jgi:undecaprenyl-diphosphatase
MTIFQAILLGILEGVTEFLPISSTGHLLIAEKLLAIPPTEFIKSFTIVIQLAAILSIVILYGKTILTKPQIIPKIAISFVVTTLIAFPAYTLVKTIFMENIWITVSALFFGGLAFIILEYMMKNSSSSINHGSELTVSKSAWIGIAQSLSIIPGVSRSAASIFGGMLVGMTREKAVEFSFLLALPTMIAATGLDIFTMGFTFSSKEYLLLAIGCLSAFASALVSVKAFVWYVRSHSFIPFAIYRIILSVLLTIIFLR